MTLFFFVRISFQFFLILVFQSSIKMDDNNNAKLFLMNLSVSAFARAVVCGLQKVQLFFLDNSHAFVTKLKM